MERDKRDNLEILGNYEMVTYTGDSLSEYSKYGVKSNWKSLNFWRSRANATWKGVGNKIGEIEEALTIAQHVVNRGEIGSDNVDSIRQHLNNPVRLAGIIAAVVEGYKHHSREDDPNLEALPLILTDLFQVLPTDVSAAMLGAIADPQVVDTIKDGNGLKAHEGINLDGYATSVFVLLPSESRHNILSEMAKEENSRYIASQLSRKVGLSWTQRDSPYGQMAIHKSLTGTQAMDKVIEVQQDMSNWRKIIGDVKNPDNSSR